MPFDYLHTAAATDVGQRRQNNEDAILALPHQGVFLVADGMGGAEAGEVASRMVREAVEQAFAAQVDGPGARARRLIAAVNGASARIRQFADAAGFVGTGSTVSLMLFDPWTHNRALTLTAGDSRIYRLRQGTLELLSRDHTVAAAAGVEDPKLLPAAFRGVLTRAAGLEDSVSLDISEVHILPKDLFLVCSDGLNGMLADKNLTKILKKIRKQSLEEVAAALIAAANDAGGKDNITVVLIQIDNQLPANHEPTPDEIRNDREEDDDDDASDAAQQRASANPNDPPTPDTATPPTDEYHNKS